MKIKRIDLAAGQSVVFSYAEGDRYVYISEGTHPTLKFGKPIKLKPGELFSVDTDSDIQVSCMYETN